MTIPGARDDWHLDRSRGWLCFAGKRILVTGGGTGLGEVMAEAYAQLGATVYICGRRAGVLEETAKRISERNRPQGEGSGAATSACRKRWTR